MLIPLAELFDPDLQPLLEAGQSGDYINLTVDKLNANEKKVYEFVLKQGGPTGLSMIWQEVFPSADAKKANSWTRNALRRLVRSKFVNKVDKGIYTANKAGDDGYPPDVTDDEKETKKGAKKKKAAGVTLQGKSSEEILGLLKGGEISTSAAKSVLFKKHPGMSPGAMDLVMKQVAKGKGSIEKLHGLLKTFGGVAEPDAPAPAPAPAPAGGPPSVDAIMKQLGMDGDEPEHEPPAPSPPTPPPSPVKPAKPVKMGKVKTLDALKFTSKTKAPATAAVAVVGTALSTTDPGAEKTNAVLSNVGRSIFTGDTIDHNAVKALVQSGEMSDSALSSAFDDLDAKGSELGVLFEEIAKGSHPKSPASQMIMATELRARRNTAKLRFERSVEDAYVAMGQKGTYNVEDGFQPEDAPETAGPKTKKVTYSANELAAKESLEVQPYQPKGDYTGPPKMTIKVDKSIGVEKLKEVLKDLGIDPDTLPPIKDGNYNYMAFVPKEAWDKAKVTRDEEIAVAGTHYKFKPHTGKARYFPALSAGQTAPNNISDLDKLDNASKVPYNGLRYTSDGGAVEGQKINVKKFRNQQGDVEYVAEFKLRQEQFGGMYGGQESKIERYNAKYDEKKGEFKISGTHHEGVPARKWSHEDGDVYLATNSYNWSMMGTVHARIRSGDDVKGALRGMLNNMKPGLGDDVLRDPSEAEAELAKANALIWSENPAHARSHPDGSSSVDAAKKVQGVSAKAMKETEQLEIMPGYQNYVRPGTWRKSTTSDGKPSASFLLYACSTPNNVVNQLVNGMLGINERASVGLGQFGSSDSSDVHSGCADNTLTRMITKSAAHVSPSHGSVSGPYQIIAPPDELDRTDAYYLHGDNYGACNPNDSHSGWAHRVSMKKSLDKQQSSYLPNGECGFRKGIGSKRIMRVTCQSEENRQNLLEAMKKKGITEVNGVPAEDFVAVSSSCGDIYEKYVKPAGY